ncbi:ekl-6, partial [Pristionchus pacificus]
LEMGEISVLSVMSVLKKAMEIDGSFDIANVRPSKTNDVKRELIKRGLGLALTEMEKHPLLMDQYDRQILKTASSSSGESIWESDARIKFGNLIIFLFANLTKAIEREKARSERTDISELSLGHHNIICQALPHLTSTSVFPYIPDGIIVLHVDTWWKTKEWEGIQEDKPTQAKKLHSYLKTILDLSDVSFQVKGTIVSRELFTVVMAAELLHHLGHTALHARYRSFLSSIDAAVVLNVASAFIRPKANQTNTQWLNKSMIGLVNDMVGKGHLRDLLRAFDSRGQLFKGNMNTMSLPFLLDLVKALCSGTAFSMSKQEYFESLVNQFFVWLDAPVVCGKDELGFILFNFFIDAMVKYQNYFAKSLIIDRFLLPLESLYESDDEEVARSFPIAALRLAKLFQNPKIRSICLVQSLRLRKLVFLFCGVSNALAEYRTHHKDDSNEIVDFQDIMNDLVRTVFEFLPKKELFILWGARQPELLPRFEVKPNTKFVNSKIKVIGEDNPIRCPVFVTAHKSSVEDHHLFLENTVTTMIDLVKVEEKADFIFTVLLEVFKAYIKDDAYFNRLSATHDESEFFYLGQLNVLALILNEKLDEVIVMDEKNFMQSVTNTTTLAKLLNLTIITMTSTVNNIEKEVVKQKKEADLDIRGGMNEFEKEVREDMISITMSTATYGIKFTKFIPLLRMIEGDKMKELDTEANEVLRLTAVLKKLLREMKEVPAEYKEIVKAFENDGDLNSTIADMEGSIKTKEDNDASFFNVEELLSLLNGLVYEKGQGLLTLSQLLLKRNFRLIQIYDDTFHDIVLGLISDSDSYVYLSAINCAAEAALAMTDKIIPFVKLFSQINSVREKKNGQGEVVKRETIQEKVIVRLRIASVICKVFDNIGAAAPKYTRETIDCAMSCVDDMDEDIRASAYAIIEYLFRTMAARYTIDNTFQPILDSINHTLTCEKSCQVRRNAIKILTNMLSGAGRDMLTTLSEQLLPINRMLTSVLQSEKDEVVILFAQLAKEEIGESLKEKMIMETTQRIRQIKM